MKTGPVRGNKNSHELTLSFLLMAALCLEAVIIQKNFFRAEVNVSWIDARHYCQKKYIDLATQIWDVVTISKWLTGLEVKNVWIGLLRDPKNASVWKWINQKTGEGITGDDFSQSEEWLLGHPIHHCAAVSAEDEQWYSFKCSAQKRFYCSVGDTVSYHNTMYKWKIASTFCQTESGYLPTINQTNAHLFYKTGWIGLHHKAAETWSWIGDWQSDYRNWAQNEPKTEDCATFDSELQKYASLACNKLLNPLCFDDNLVVVKENKTWENALKHCWTLQTPCYMESCVYRYRLLSLKSFQYAYARDRIYRATTNEVWTGLRFLGGRWLWVNGERMEDNGMLPDCPPQQKRCGVLSKNDTNNWIIRDCTEKRNFICYGFKVGIVTAQDSEP